MDYMLQFALISKSRTKKVPNSCVDIELVLLVPRHWMCCGLFTYSHTILWYRTLRYESSTGTRSVLLASAWFEKFQVFLFRPTHGVYIHIYMVLPVVLVPYVYEMVGWRSTCRWYSNPCLDFIYESREYSFDK